MIKACKFCKGGIMKRIFLIFILCFCSALLGGYLASKQDEKRQEQCLTYFSALNTSSEITYAVGVLLKIQRGDIVGATELLERSLDIDLQTQSAVAPKTEHNSMEYVECINAIKIAKYYRECYKSHKIHPNLIESVNKAFSIVNITGSPKCEEIKTFNDIKCAIDDTAGQ